MRPFENQNCRQYEENQHRQFGQTGYYISIVATVINKISSEFPLIPVCVWSLPAISFKNAFIQREKHQRQSDEVFSQRRVLGIKAHILFCQIRIARSDMRHFINNQRVAPQTGYGKKTSRRNNGK